MCVNMFVCTHMCVHAYVCAYMCVCAHMRAYTRTHQTPLTMAVQPTSRCMWLFIRREERTVKTRKQASSLNHAKLSEGAIPLNWSTQPVLSPSALNAEVIHFMVGLEERWPQPGIRVGGKGENKNQPLAFQADVCMPSLPVTDKGGQAMHCLAMHLSFFPVLFNVF